MPAEIVLPSGARTEIPRQPATLSTESKVRTTLAQKIKAVSRNQMGKLFMAISKGEAGPQESPYIEPLRTKLAQKTEQAAEGVRKDARVNAMVGNMADRYGAVANTFSNEGGVFTDAQEAQERSMQELAKFMSVPVGETNFPNGITMSDVVKKITDVAAAIQNRTLDSSQYKDVSENGGLNIDGLAPWALGGMQKTLRLLAKGESDPTIKAALKQAKADLLSIRRALGATGVQQMVGTAVDAAPLMPMMAQNAGEALQHGAKVAGRIGGVKGLQGGFIAAARKFLRSTSEKIVSG